MEKTTDNKATKSFPAPVLVAKYYGFCPAKTSTLTKSDFDFAKPFEKEIQAHEFACILRTYIDEKRQTLPQPILEWYDRPFPGSGERKKSMRLEGSLVSIGSVKSVCECLSIEVLIGMLESAGYKNIEVRLNSIGDKESTAEFERKHSAYIKKAFGTFPGDLRQEIKDDEYVLLKSNKESWKAFRDCCPKPLDFLSEQSRLHFKDILEFLEIRNIPYSIDDSLMVDPKFASETIISIVDKDNEILARGIRANRLAKKLGYKKEIALLKFDLSAKLKKNVKIVNDKPVKPKFYLIQFGPEAKLKSFLVLHELFKSNLPIIHSIAKDKLGSQIGVAENSGIPYIILLGQKEALDNTIVLRNTFTRAQEIIPIHDLGSRLKNLED